LVAETNTMKATKREALIIIIKKIIKMIKASLFVAFIVLVSATNQQQ
jgi:hypothetical protein